MEFGGTSYVEEIRMKAQEEIDKFIIETVYPFAQTEKMEISKEDLRKAILMYYGKDAQEVKHGEWVQNKYNKAIFHCSECGRHIEDESEYKNVLEHFPYCHCGARMDGDQNV